MAGTGRGPATSAGGRGFVRDDRAQQFVLEAVIVAIVAVTTIVMVADLQPSAPAIEQPKTHKEFRDLAQDSLNNLYAQDRPACRSEGPMMGCHGGTLLHELVLRTEVMDDDAICGYFEDRLPPNTYVVVTLDNDARTRVLCGEAPPDDANWVSEAGRRSFMPEISYAHVFTDFDDYNANDPTAAEILRDWGLKDVVETRAQMRVTVLPTRNGLPIGPFGDALVAIVETEGSPTANMTYRSYGHTQESIVDDQPFAQLYLEYLEWCRPWDSNQTGNPDDPICEDPEPAHVDNVDYDAHLDDRYFGNDPPEDEVTFTVRVRESADVEVPNATRLVIKVPPDWDLGVWNQQLGQGPFGREANVSGSIDLGWTIEAKTNRPIQNTIINLTFEAKPPNPTNLDTRDDPHTPVYIFRAWLENGAHAQLDFPVHLDPSDPDVLPVRAGVLCTVSPAAPMGNDDEGWMGVACRNPTGEDVTITRVQLKSADENPIFKNVNLSSAKPDGKWRVRGLQDETELLDNWHFDDPTLAPWRSDVWTPDNTWDPPFDANRTSVVSDSQGRPHVLYTRASDGRIVHTWMERDAEGLPVWQRELTPYRGQLGPRSAVVDRAGTPADASDDVLHLAFTGGRHGEPGVWYAVRDPDEGWKEAERLKGVDTFPAKKLENISSAEKEGLEKVPLWPVDVHLEMDAGGALHLTYIVRSESGVTNYTGVDQLFYLVSDPSIHDEPANCNAEGDDWSTLGWWCREIPIGDEVEARKMASALGPGGMHFAYQVNVDAGDFRVRYCQYPCSSTVELQRSTAMWTGRPVDVGFDADGQVHVAYAIPLEVGVGDSDMARGTDVTNGIEGIYHAVPEANGTGCRTDEWTCTKVSGDLAHELALSVTASSADVEILYKKLEVESGSTSQGDPPFRLMRAYSKPDAACGAAVGWACEDLDLEGTGNLLSLATDARGIVHVAHLGQDATDREETVRYHQSEMGRGRWRFEPGPAGYPVTSRVGGSVAAATDAVGNVHVAYRDEHFGGLKYARWDRADASWTVELIDRAPGDDTLAWRTDIAVVGGVPHVAYLARDHVRIAVRDGGSSGGGAGAGECLVHTAWSCRPLASTARLGEVLPKYTDVSIGADADGTVAVLYHAPDETLSVAVHTPGLTTCSVGGTATTNWSCTDVGSGSLRALYPAMVATDDELHVAWYDYFGTQLLQYTKAAKTQVGGVSTYASFDVPTPVDTVPLSARAPAMAARADGRVLILYEGFDDALDVDGDLRVAEQDPASLGDEHCAAGWRCEDARTLSTWWPGRGDLTVDPTSGAFHGLLVEASGVLRYVREAPDTEACEEGQDVGFECETLVRAGFADEAGAAAAALVTVDGTPHVLFEHRDELWAARRTGNDDGTCPRSIPWHCERVDDGTTDALLGVDPALAVDRDGRPHVAQYEAVLGDLVVSDRTAPTWRSEVVDRGLTTTDAGDFLGADHDDAGRLHALYMDVDAGELMYLTNATASGAFAVETVERTEARSIDVVVRDGTVHAAWVDAITDDVHHAERASPAGGSGPAVGSDAGCLDGAWTCTAVTTLGNPAEIYYKHQQLGLAVTADGRVAVVYQKGYDVWRAERAPGAGAGDGSGCSASTAWTCAELDDAGSTGWYIAAEAAPDGRIGAVYHTDAGPDLLEPFQVRYAERDPATGAWSVEAVDVFADWGWFADLAYDASADPDGRAVVGYAVGEGAGFLVKTARADGSGGWDIASVVRLDGLRDVAMALDPGDGRAALATLQQVDGGWTLGAAEQVAGDDSCGPAGDAGWSCTTVDASAKRLAYPRVHVPAGGSNATPAVAYYHERWATLFLAERTGGSGGGGSPAQAAWSLEELPASERTKEGDVGRYASIVLDPDGRPHVSYYDVSDGDLKYATRDAEGSWRTETVDATGDTGLFTSIAHDGEAPMIAYHDETRGLLRFARLDPGTGAWSLETVNGSGTWKAGMYASLALDSLGRPMVAYQRIDGNGTRHLAVAYRTGIDAGCTAADEHPSWTCGIVDRSADTELGASGTWASLALDPDDVPIVMYGKSSDLGLPAEAHGLWGASTTVQSLNGTGADDDTITFCPDSDWRCGQFDDAASRWIYPAVVADRDDRRFGLYVDPDPEAVEDTGLGGGSGQLALAGVRAPVLADVYAFTDAVADTETPCPFHPGFECRLVAEDVRVGYTDAATDPAGFRSYGTLESVGERTFLFGSNRDWGRATVVGINATRVSQGVGDRALHLERTFTSTSPDHEVGGVVQDVVVSDRPAAAVLGFDWTKAVEGADDLDLETFRVTMAVRRVTGGVPGPAEVVWTSAARAGMDGETVRTRLPVTEFVERPGTYRFEVTLEVRGRTTAEGAAPTVSFTVDDLFLTAYENRRLVLDNPRFDADDDRLEASNGTSWDVARDGGWEVESAFGTDADDTHYMKTWTSLHRPGRDGLLQVGEHATTEMDHLADPAPTSATGLPTISNALNQSFTIETVDGEAPTSVRFRAQLYQWARSMRGAQADVALDGDGTGDLRQQKVSTPAPECDRDLHPEEDPCSAYSTTPGVESPLGDVLADPSRLTVTVRLVHESGAEVRVDAKVTDLSGDAGGDDCAEACEVRAFTYGLEEDLTAFVDAHGPGDYTLEVRTEADLTLAATDEGIDADKLWVLVQIVAGLDDAYLEVDYKGGHTVEWEGRRTIPARHSDDWAFKVVGNDVLTRAAGDRVQLPVAFSNDHTTDLLHMPRYGMYEGEVRPETVDCSSGPCEGEGDGFDSAEKASVKPTLWFENPVFGRADYENHAGKLLHTTGLAHALRDKAFVEARGGTGRYNAIPIADEDGNLDAVRVCWSLREVADAAKAIARSVDAEKVDVLRPEVRIYSPVFGVEQSRLRTLSLDDCASFSFADDDYFWYGPYAVEASLAYNVTLVDGTVTQGRGRVVDYFTLVPPDGDAESLPVYDLKVQVWWFDG